MKELMSGIPTRDVFSVPIHAVTLDRALELIHSAIQHRRSMQIGVVNAAKLVNMNRQNGLRDDVLSSDLILADGSAVVWASRLLGQRLPQRVTGIDLMYGMLKRGNQAGYRVYCLGAKEEVSLKVAERIQALYPGVCVVGRHHGYFNQDEESDIAEHIRETRPDILLVAITSPKKEKFLARWSSQMGVPVCHGVGGSFDVLAGMVERAPAGWQKMGLEWLYRLKQEPRRLWRRYFITNALFITMLISEFIQRCVFKKQSAR